MISSIDQGNSRYRRQGRPTRRVKTMMERLLFSCRAIERRASPSWRSCWSSTSRSAAMAEFLSPQFMSVVLRDTGRLGLIAVAEVMLMITGEIDLSVSGTFSIAPYMMVLMSIAWGVPLGCGATVGVAHRRAGRLHQRHHHCSLRVPSLITTVGTLVPAAGHRRFDLQ